MQFSKLIAAGFVVLLAAGGVAAAGTGIGPMATPTDTSTVTNADVYASSENQTVTLTLVDDADGEGVANATVDVDREYEHDDRDEDDEDGSARVGTTDANGEITVSLDPENESRTVTALDVEFAKGAFVAELEYRLENDSLTLLEETYEYEEAEETYDDDGNRTEADDGEQLSVDISDARATAAAALNEPPQGEWVLTEADAHEGDNYYEFEYALKGAESPGEAEIRVHGDSGDVIEYEQEIEASDDEEHPVHEDEHDEAESGTEADEHEGEDDEHEGEDDEREGEDDEHEGEDDEREEDDDEREDDADETEGDEGEDD